MGLRFKLEYDTSNPDLIQSLKTVKSRFNIGVNYSLSDNLKISHLLLKEVLNLDFLLNLKVIFFKIPYLNQT